MKKTLCSFCNYFCMWENKLFYNLLRFKIFFFFPSVDFLLQECNKTSLNKGNHAYLLLLSSKSYFFFNGRPLTPSPPPLNGPSIKKNFLCCFPLVMRPKLYFDFDQPHYVEAFYPKKFLSIMLLLNTKYWIYRLLLHPHTLSALF